MERSDVVGLILNSEKMIEVFIKEIDEDVNKSNYLSFMGTPSLKIWDIAKDIDKIAKYILDGKEDFERFKTELFNIRTRTKELQSKTFQKYEPFAHHCDMIINIIDNMERFAPNQPSIVPNIEAGNINGLSTGENDRSGNKNLSEAEVRMQVKNEPFQARKGGKPIPYKECYKRLTEGKIRHSAGNTETIEVIDKQYNFDLFKYSVERADISKLFTKGKKSFARLFMNDIAQYFDDPSAFRAAAAKAFGVTKLGVGKNGEGINADYHILMKDIFSKDTDYRKQKPKGF